MRSRRSVPSTGWYAVLALAVVAALSAGTVVGAGLSLWRGSAAQRAVAIPREPLLRPGSGVVTVPAPPPQPRVRPTRHLVKPGPPHQVSPAQVAPPAPPAPVAVAQRPTTRRSQPAPPAVIQPPAAQPPVPIRVTQPIVQVVLPPAPVVPTVAAPVVTTAAPVVTPVTAPAPAPSGIIAGSDVDRPECDEVADDGATVVQQPGPDEACPADKAHHGHDAHDDKKAGPAEQTAPEDQVDLAAASGEQKASDKQKASDELPTVDDGGAPAAQLASTVAPSDD